MKKIFSILAIALLAFSFFAAAPSHPTSAQIGAEAQADADLPDVEPIKATAHTLFIADTHGIGVDTTDANNFVVVRAVVGRVVLTKRMADADNASGGNPDNEARCNARDRCFVVRKVGVLTVISKDATTRYHLKNVVTGDGSVLAEVFKGNQSVGSASLSLTELAGGNKVWAGKASISGKVWALYFPFKDNRKLVRPAVVHKAMEVGNRCGLTRPLDASEIRECVKNGGKTTVTTVEGCPAIHCVKPHTTVGELTANIKARCDAKGGVLVRRQLPMHLGAREGFSVVCVVDGKVVEENGGSTQQAGTANATPSATATVQATTEATATPSPSAQAQASVSASVAARTS